MANEIFRKMTSFSYLFASVISQTSTKHIWRQFQSLGYTKIRLLMPFPCISCISSSSNNIIGNMSCRCSNSSTDLHEVFRYPENRQDLQQNRITFRHCPVSHHTWAKMMCSNNDWAAIIPIFPHEGNFDLPERHFWPPKDAIPHNFIYTGQHIAVKSYNHLTISLKKDCSAWTEVSSGACCSTASIDDVLTDN